MLKEKGSELNNSGSSFNSSKNRLSKSELSLSKAKFSKITSETDGPKTERLVFPSTISENIGALLTKRLHVYKRDKAGIVCEIIVPFIMVLIGCCMTKINLTKNSINRTLSPDLYPTPQRILMNEFNVV